MKVKKKRIMQVSALLVGLFVLVQTVLSEIPENTFAQQSFNGIESLIQSHDETDPFTIVELVPDVSYAKLGYLVGGSEPFGYDGEESLSTLTGPEARTAFFSQLAENLSAIISTETVEKPVNYVSYQESYVSREGYTMLQLAEEEIIAKGTSGYAMQQVGANQGDYRLSASYTRTEGGSWDQNVDYYIADGSENKYYDVTFVYVSDPNNDDRTLYTAKASDLDSEDLSSMTDFANVYYYDEDLGYIVKYAGEDTSDEKLLYYTVYFEKADKVEEDKTYFAVGTVTFVADGASYGAQLNETAPYQEVTEGTGHFSADGIFYEYVGKNEGDCQLVADMDTSLEYPVKVSSIYYTGGFTSNEWFKEYVFNQSGLLNDADIAVTVVALTPAQLADYNGEMDLLYISGSSLSASSEQSTYYDVENDISDALENEIYAQVVSESTYLPVILDSAILQKTDIQNTNVYDLAKRLIGQDVTIENYAKGYVSGNVYVIPCDSAATAADFLNTFGSLLLDGSDVTGSVFTEKAADMGFGEVAKTIVTENLSRQAENEAGTGTTYAYFDQIISAAINVEYIISYGSKRQEYELETIQVLDIEPCIISDASQEEIENKIRSYLQLEEDDGSKVVVTHMSSAEFIGKVEDLSKYDMIYMGLYTDTLNTDEVTGRTVYNDKTMDGLVYTNIGDIQYDVYALGLLDTEYVNWSDHYSFTKLMNLSGSKEIDYNGTNYVRYSGNDFTDEKVSAIENFVKSGLPVILADSFLVTAGGKTYVYDYARNSNGSKDTSSQGYIDNCSKVYELINEIKDSTNVMTETSVAKSSEVQQLLLSYLSIGKPRLTVYADNVSGQEYVKTDGEVVSFDFSIENSGSADANATFDCILYADYNADGRYSSTTECIGANDFSITLNGVKQEVKSGTENGTTYYYYELSPNNNGSKYHLEYELSSDYVGVIPIKIKVSQSNNAYRYASEERYFYRENTQGKVKIRVLQIMPTGGAQQFDMGQLDETSAFYRYLHALEDYDISIDSMTAAAYAEMYDTNPNFLDEYDMLVLGFADCYNFLQVSGYNEAATIKAYQGIEEFIDSGKSVLFTHDTTSYRVNPDENAANKNNKKSAGEWGLVLNYLLPQDVGFDRYGVNESLLLRAGINNLSSEDNTTTYNVSGYQSLRTAKNSSILTKDTYTASELFQLIVKEAEANNKDVAYKPNSDKKTLVSEVQGQSSVAINRNAGLTGGLLNVNNAQIELPTTNTTELLNEGQILIYPYNILDEIKKNDNLMTVATTHGQYYQIDMNEDADGDGESDITVWLSLAGDSYDFAQRDARNNYYIYTKGNVTYSGVGHWNMDSYYDATNGSNELEIKLYINTMVVAYQAGAHAPTVTLTGEDDTELGVIYVGVDSLISESGKVTGVTQVDTGSEKVYFTVKDTNNASGGSKKISVAYYLVYGSSKDDLPEGVTLSNGTGNEGEDASAVVTVDGIEGVSATAVNIGTDTNPVYASKCNWQTYSAGGNTQSASNITSGAKYYINVPYSIVDKVKNSRAQIYVMATTSLWSENANPSTAQPTGTYSSYSELYVQRIGLFDLD